MSHVRAAALVSATFLTSGALALSLVVAPAQAVPLESARPATAVQVTTTAATAPTTQPGTTAAQAKKQARALAKKRYQRNVRTKVVRIAKRKVGKARYVAGAAGPNRFDCSGLALYVWRKAARRHLPHYSVAQERATRDVSRRNLRRGDLVFFFRQGAHHVGIYIGKGKMVGAANPRSGIKVDRVFSGWYGQRYSGAGRLF